MNGGDAHEGTPGRGVSRRNFVKATGASGAAVGLAGCIGHPLAGAIAGSSGASSNTVRWITGTTEADSPDVVRNALYEAGLSRDIELEIIAGPANTDSRQSQYTRWLSADLEDPDLLNMDSGWALNFIQRNQVMNLTENLSESVLNRINSEYFQASVDTAEGQNGDLYAVPFFPDFPTMLYRKDLVEQAGYNPEGENWATESMRWKKFSKVVADAKEQSGVEYGFGFQASVYEGLSCCDFNEFMSSWGGAYFGGRDTLFGPIGERPVTVAEQPVVDAIRMLRTFIFGPNAPNTLDGYEQISPNAVLSWIEGTSLAPFVNGNMVALRNWPYAIPIAGADDALGDRLGVMPIPYAVTDQQSKYRNIGGPVAALGGWHVAANPNTRQKEAALAVLETMTRPEFQLAIFESFGFIPPNRQVFGSQRAKSVPIIGNFIEQLQIAGQNAIARPVSVVWPQESTKISQQVHAGMDGSTSPQQAMNTLSEQLTAIEEYNG